MHVAHIKSNVKKGVDCRLGRLTLLVGPNGAGKTSVQNALELALAGFASDVEGRGVVKKGDMLAKLGPPGVPLIAEATLADGAVANWTLTPNKRGGFKEPVHTKPPFQVVFPVQQVREILAGNPDTVRLWLMGKVGADISLEEVATRFPTDLADGYRTLAARVRGAGMSEVDVLLAVIDFAGAEVRRLNAESKGGEQTLDTLSADVGEEPTQSELAQAQAATAHAQAELDKARLAVRPDPAALHAQALTAIQALQEAESAWKQACAGLPLLDPKAATATALRETLLDVCKLHLKLAASGCMVCGTPDRKTAIAAVTDAYEQANAETAKAVNAHRQAAQRETVVKARREEAQQAVAAFQAAQRQNAEQPDVAGCADRLIAARDALVKLEQQARVWRQIRGAKDQIRLNTRRVKELKELAEAAESVVEELLARAQRRFEASVQRHLPASDVFALVLAEGKKPVCRLGFRRGDVLHTALSGAEGARLSLALGCATYTPDDHTLAVFMPEERAFDPETLRDVMNALASAPGQVLLQSPVTPAEGYGAAWSVVRL